MRKEDRDTQRRNLGPHLFFGGGPSLPPPLPPKKNSWGKRGSKAEGMGRSALDRVCVWPKVGLNKLEVALNGKGPAQSVA
jgi:hypothetical protein